jgi:hypothetical protein
MAKQKGRPENLIPANKRTKEEARELGRRGGVASGEARRKKKYFKEIYAEMLADEYQIEKEGKTVTGLQLVKEVARDVLLRKDSASVSMLDQMRKTLDGDSLEIEATVEQVDATEGMTYEQKKKLAEEWLAKHR